MARPEACSPARRRWLAAACLAACSAATALPAAPAPHPGDQPYTVQAGDTLIGLAGAYLDSAQQWPALRSHNRVADPQRLQPGSVLWLPAALLRARAVPAHIDFVEGDVRVTGPGQQAGVPLRAGSEISEGTRLQVPTEGFVTVRLADGSTVRVQAQSDLALTQSRRRGRAGSVQSLIDLRRGGVESAVQPQQAPGRRFDIRTPLAVASVRGTEFDVSVTPSGGVATAVTHGTVAVRAAQNAAAPQTLVPAGFGAAVAADGRLGASRPLLPAPALAAPLAPVGEAGPFTLAWQPLPGAVQYQVRIAADDDFTRVVRNGRFDAAQARFDELPDGSYTLAVRAVDDAGIPGQAAQWPFQIKTLPLPPLYQQPAPGGMVSRTDGELLCTGVPGVRAFHLQVAAQDDFAAVALDAPRQDSCRLAVAPLSPGRYFWRAASIGAHADGSDDAGPFAPAQSFIVGEPPAGAEPEAGTSAAGTARLFWSGRPGQRFRLQVARDLGFAEVVRDVDLAEPAWTADGLPAGRYYIRLQVRDGDSGLASPFSGPRQFDVRALLRTGDESGAVNSSDGRPVGYQ